MGSFSLWHILIIFIVALPVMMVPLIVVLTMPKPQGRNRFGAPSRPAASGQALIRGLKNYFVFRGRASRSEYWWFLFWVFLVYLVAGALVHGGGGAANAFGGVAVALSFIPILFYIPLLSAGVRRLQDANRSGLWVLLAFGGFTAIALLVLLAEPSRDDIDEGNAFS